MHNGRISTDDELAAAASGRDERAARQLYDRYADRVFRIVYRVVLDESLAKDAAQESWIKIFRSLKRRRPTGSFAAWISIISVRTAIDLARKRARSSGAMAVEEMEAHLASNDPSARQQSAEREIEAKVMRVLDALPENQRAAFILRHFENMPLREIGRELGCSEGTVKAHIYRAANAVRRRLAKFLGVEMKKS